MKKLLMVPLILLLLVPTQFINASFAYTLDYEVKPSEGPYDQQILFMIRCYPIVDTHQMYYYVFWDGVPLNIRVASTAYSKTQYNHYYDIKITPPEGYNTVGDHRIDVWLEDYNGTIKKLHYNYEITDGPLTTVEAWGEYLKEHPEIIAQLKGEKGATGAKGETGATGAKGAKGDTGAAGIAGVNGVNGVNGKNGVDGKDASPLSLVICVFISVALNTVITYYLLNQKKGGP